MSSVTVNGIRFALNGEVADEMGYWANDVTGWYDYSATISLDPRIDQAGSFAPDAVYSPGTTPSLAGVCNMANGYEAARAKARLRSTIKRGELVEVVYDDNGFITQRELFVENITMPHNHGRPGFTWALDMSGNDPYMYGPEQQDSTGLPKGGGGVVFPVTFPVNFGEPADKGQLELVNTGLAPTFSRFEIDGGFDAAGFSIVKMSTGERITLARSVPVGSTVYINTRSGRVSIDGYDNDISGYLTQYDWFETAAESTDVIQFLANGVSSGTPRLRSFTRSAY